MPVEAAVRSNLRNFSPPFPFRAIAKYTIAESLQLMGPHAPQHHFFASSPGCSIPGRRFCRSS